ncbi:MAG: VacJ family lipoprotein [Pseudomonadota bacterium]
MISKNLLRAIVWGGLCLGLIWPIFPASAPPLYAAESKAAEGALDEDDLAFLEKELPAEEIVSVSDPLESFNRDMFAFNDTFYFAILKPVTRAYRFVVPSDVRIPLRNFFDNLMAPVRIVNCLLQAKWKAGAGELGGFFINTTAGVFGFGDPAQRYPGLNPPEEDLGQTLAVWGVANGPYLVLPLIGFSTVRDAAGWLGDTYLDPLFYTAVDWQVLMARLAVKTVNSTSFRLGDYETVKAAAIDPYVAFRNGYLQFRQKKVLE